MTPDNTLVNISTRSGRKICFGLLEDIHCLFGWEFLTVGHPMSWHRRHRYSHYPASSGMSAPLSPLGYPFPIFHDGKNYVYYSSVIVLFLQHQHPNPDVFYRSELFGIQSTRLVRIASGIPILPSREAASVFEFFLHVVGQIHSIS